MLIEWSVPALGDLEEIAGYLRKDDEAMAVAMVQRVFAAAEMLQDFPRAGREGRVKGTREMLVKRAPYVLVYVTLEDRVVILRALHERRDWPGSGEEEDWQAAAIEEGVRQADAGDFASEEEVR